MVESLWLRSGEKEEGGRKGGRREGRKEGRTALIKSNNPHLAGDGECFNAMVGITRSKVIAFFAISRGCGLPCYILLGSRNV